MSSQLTTLEQFALLLQRTVARNEANFDRWMTARGYGDAEEAAKVRGPSTVKNSNTEPQQPTTA
jgi:hypothetical protein